MAGRKEGRQRGAAQRNNYPSKSKPNLNKAQPAAHLSVEVVSVEAFHVQRLGGGLLQGVEAGREGSGRAAAVWEVGRGRAAAVWEVGRGRAAAVWEGWEGGRQGERAAQYARRSRHGIKSRAAGYLDTALSSQPIQQGSEWPRPCCRPPRTCTSSQWRSFHTGLSVFLMTLVFSTCGTGGTGGTGGGTGVDSDEGSTHGTPRREQPCSVWAGRRHAAHAVARTTPHPTPARARPHPAPATHRIWFLGVHQSEELQEGIGCGQGRGGRRGVGSGVAQAARSGGAAKVKAERGAGRQDKFGG